MENRESMRCEHLACLCEVGPAGGACSDYCTSPEARDPHAVVCRCGHAVCEEQTRAQLHGGAGKESAG